MADIAAEAGVLPDEPAVQGASKLFGYLWKEAWEHAHGTAAGDADDLHDMRVNLRRLRTVMQNYEGTKVTPLLSGSLRGEVREERARIGTLGDKLGAVRDHDVLADYIQHYLKHKLHSTLEDNPGLAALDRYLSTERANCFSPMVKKLNRAGEPGALRESFGRWALGLPAANAAAISCKTAAAVILPRRLDEIQLHAVSLEPGADREAQHELRKSLRRLRYTLETTSVCFQTPVKPAIKTLVLLQDLLGEMQDRTVLQETSARAFPAEIPPDVQDFNLHGDRRRSYLLGRVRTLWKETTSHGFWEDLKNLQ